MPIHSAERSDYALRLLKYHGFGPFSERQGHARATVAIEIVFFGLRPRLRPRSGFCEMLSGSTASTCARHGATTLLHRRLLRQPNDGSLDPHPVNLASVGASHRASVSECCPKAPCGTDLVAGPLVLLMRILSKGRRRNHYRRYHAYCG